MRGGEAVNKVQEDGLGVRVGRVWSHRVEHGVAKCAYLLFLMCVLDCPGGRYHSIHEEIVVRQSLKIEIINPLAYDLVRDNDRGTAGT